MEKRKEQEARIKTVILNMDLSNKKCADCENENVTFVSINNGTVICSDCAEKHKHLSYWISFIKSFNEKWDDYLLKYLKNGGNSRYLKFCKDYKIENIQSIDRYKTKGVEYYRLILKSEVMGFDPPDNINVNSAGEILENIENNYPEFENYSYVKHVDLEKLEKQFEIDKKFNEENNAGIFQTFSGFLGNFGKKLNEAKDNIVGKVNEKWNEEGGLMEKMKGMTEGVKNKYYQFMGKSEEYNKNVEKNMKENINENQNKNIENISFNDLKELKEQKNKSSNKNLNSSENNKGEKIIIDEKKEETINKEEKIIIDDEKEEKLDELEKPIQNEENIINKNEESNENKKEKVEYKSETIEQKKEKIQQNEDSNFDEKNIINEEKINNIDNQETQTKKIESNEQNLSESKEIKNKKNEEINNKNKLDDILKEEIEEENKMPTNPEEIKQKLDDIINEKEEKENNKKENEKNNSNEIKKTKTNESNKISDKDEILKKETLRSVTSEMFLDENQLNEILGDDKEDDL